MEIQVKIQNLNEVKAALIKSPQIVSKHINKAIKKSILEIRNESEDTVPVKTGYLKSSITLGMSFSNLRGQIRPTAKYAYWVEVLPYKHIVGQSHWLQAGVDNANSKINENFKESLKDSLNEIASLAK